MVPNTVCHGKETTVILHRVLPDYQRTFIFSSRRTIFSYKKNFWNTTRRGDHSNENTQMIIRDTLFIGPWLPLKIWAKKSCWFTHYCTGTVTLSFDEILIAIWFLTLSINSRIVNLHEKYQERLKLKGLVPTATGQQDSCRWSGAQLAPGPVDWSTSNMTAISLFANYRLVVIWPIETWTKWPLFFGC